MSEAVICFYFARSTECACKISWTRAQRLRYCWDGCAMLHNSNFRCQVRDTSLLVFSSHFKYHHKSYIAKNNILLASFLSQSVDLSLITLTRLIGTKAAELVEIMQNSGHYALQAHSRS